MGGSFAAVNTALSALRYSRVALDTASQNIANVATEGYTRRRVDAVTAGTPTTPAVWSRNQDAGAGVRITGETRLTDALLDARVRAENGKQSYLDVRQEVLERLEAGIGEPSDTGFATVLAEFRQAWSDLANNPSSDAVRVQVLSRGQAMADAVRIQVRNFSAEAADERVRLNGLVEEANLVAGDLAVTNRAIAVALLDGSDAGNLLDQRDLLGLRLTKLTGGTAVVNATGGLDVTLGGSSLVTDGTAGQLRIASGVTPSGAADGSPVTFAMTTPQGSTTPVEVTNGQVGGVTDLLNTTLPDYLRGLDSVARRIADDVNALHRTGYDATGQAGRDFFGYVPSAAPGELAASLTVAFADATQLAASQLPGGVVDGRNASALSELTGAETVYQQLVNSFGSTVASSRRLATSQQALTDQVDGAREQLAGVNLDEEMTMMVQYQRAYEAAARVLTTVDSVLDTLINRTGLR